MVTPPGLEEGGRKSWLRPQAWRRAGESRRYAPRPGGGREKVVVTPPGLEEGGRKSWLCTVSYFSIVPTVRGENARDLCYIGKIDNAM